MIQVVCFKGLLCGAAEAVRVPGLEAEASRLEIRRTKVALRSKV